MFYYASLETFKLNYNYSGCYNKNHVKSISVASTSYRSCSDFVKTHLINHERVDEYLLKLNDFYVLYIHKNDMEGNKSQWDELFKKYPKSMSELTRTAYIALGFVVISKNPKAKKTSFVIESVEEIIKGYDIKYIILNRIQEKLNVDNVKRLGIPVNISDDFKFWRNHLENLFDTQDEFWDFVKEQKIPTDLLRGYDSVTFIRETDSDFEESDYDDDSDNDKKRKRKIK